MSGILFITVQTNIIAVDKQISHTYKKSWILFRDKNLYNHMETGI